MRCSLICTHDHEIDQTIFVKDVWCTDILIPNECRPDWTILRVCGVHGDCIFRRNRPMGHFDLETSLLFRWNVCHCISLLGVSESWFAVASRDYTL